ncbi:phosphotransferase [Stutzerimonas chloritidismutans]
MAQWHVSQGFSDPTKTPLVRQILKGIRTPHPRQQKQAVPIQLRQLEQCVLSLERNGEQARAEDDWPRFGRCWRDRALMLIGFWRAFRSDELRISWAEMPRSLQLDAASARTLCLNMLDAMAALHRLGTGVSRAGKRRQRSGLLSASGGRLGPALRGRAHLECAQLRKVREWLKRNTPADRGSCVIHNDWRFDNLILDPQDPTRIIGVLDWELATVSDPLMDLGSMLAYWIQADHNRLMRASRRQPRIFLACSAVRKRWPTTSSRLACHATTGRLRDVRTVPPVLHCSADLLPLPPPPNPQSGVQALLADGELP